MSQRTRALDNSQVAPRNTGSQQASAVPITFEQKWLLITTYKANGGNMAAAMREAKIVSRKTAYLWWQRFLKKDVEGLQPGSHARKTSSAVAAPIAEMVCTLRRQHSHWGRRRIARALAAGSGRAVISPSGVEAVLRRAGLWERASCTQTIPTMPQRAAHCPSPLAGGPLNVDEVLTHMQNGLQASMASDAATAVSEFAGHVWEPLQQHWDVASRLLNDKKLGRWLLRSWIQLGHSYMNTGQWSHARNTLAAAMQWMDSHVPPLLDRPAALPDIGVSLDWNDIWLDGYQYLGILWRDLDGKSAEGYLESVIPRMDRHDRQGRIPTNYSGHRANYERDLSKQKLRRLRQLRPGQRISLAEITQHLNYAQSYLEGNGAYGMQAATCIVWADLYSVLATTNKQQDRLAWKHHLDAMEEAIEQALLLVQQETAPLLRTNFVISAARFRRMHGITIDTGQLIAAAQRCLLYGYGGQAQKLLKLPTVTSVLPEEIVLQLHDRFNGRGH